MENAISVRQETEQKGCYEIKSFQMKKNNHNGNLKLNLKTERKMPLVQAQPAMETIANPHLQVEKTKEMLSAVINRAREDLKSVTNRKARTLLETTVALIEGLLKAYEHYEYCWKQKRNRTNFKGLN
jgi:hypothetical protein